VEGDESASFRQQKLYTEHVLALIKEEVQLRRLACAGGGPATYCVSSSFMLIFIEYEFCLVIL
jgi:hypothetical protein